VHDLPLIQHPTDLLRAMLAITVIIDPCCSAVLIRA